MTVCIAAIYQDDNPIQTGLVLLTDSQITDTNTSFKSVGMKMAVLSEYILIMGAGDMTFFGDLVARTTAKINKLNRRPTVEDAAEKYWESQTDWQNEYREQHVLGKFKLNWESYIDGLANESFPPSFIAEVNGDLKSLQMPCSADVIIAGSNIDVSTFSKSDRIIKIENGVKDSMMREGYAVIGEGSTVALTEFAAAGYSRYWSKPKAIMLSYIAKKRSEAIASVGEKTLLMLMDSGGTFLVSENHQSALNKIWIESEKTKTKAEEKAYDKATTLFKEQPAPPRRTPPEEPVLKSDI